VNKVDEFAEKFAQSLKVTPVSLGRLITEPCGLTPEEMMAALAHPLVGQAGIDLMADFMHPTNSRYFDAIYGSYYGQRDIRGWLVPMMSEISFIEFVPTSEPEFFDDGEGVTTVDEWQMVADMAVMGMGEGKMPMSRGVSVRRYRDSWMTWACDVYDTGSFRVPPPPGVEAAPLPDAPSPNQWERHAATPVTVCSEVDFDADCEQFHPTDSVYIDPIFGEFHGRDEIKSWIMDIMPRVGRIEFVPVGPELNNGKTYLQEWVQVAVTSTGERVPMTRGTSVRRYKDGSTIYAADYFDTATLTTPEVLAASRDCGSTITTDDIMKYKLRGL
jgi:hypothetical protein